MSTTTGTKCRLKTYVPLRNLSCSFHTEDSVEAPTKGNRHTIRYITQHIKIKAACISTLECRLLLFKDVPKGGDCILCSSLFFIETIFWNIPIH